MGEASDKLKQEWLDANRAANAAGVAANEARDRYLASVLADTGLEGHIVEGGRYAPGLDGKTERILVKRTGSYRYAALVRGPVIKKDGTPGGREAEIYIEGSKDHGLYQAQARK